MGRGMAPPNAASNIRPLICGAGMGAERAPELAQETPGREPLRKETANF